MSTWRVWLAGVGLGALCLGLYFNVLQGEFQFDDQTSILENGAIRHPSLPALWGYWPTRIVAYATVALDFRLYGLRPLGYHVTNVVIHTGAVLAVLWLLFGLLRTRWPASASLGAALAGAVVFAGHPLQTQAVAYIIQRTAALCALFYVLALALHVHGWRRRTASDDGREGTGPDQGLRARAAEPLAWLCGLLATLTKEPAVSLPVALLLVDAVALPRPGRWRRVLPFVPLAFVPLGVALLGGESFGNAEQASVLAETGTVGRTTYLLTQVEVVARYLWLLIVPWGQNIDHDVAWWSGVTPRFLLLLLLHVALITGAVVLWRRRHRLTAAAIAWLYVALAPESSVYPIADAMFEHRMYLAMVGPGLAVALCVAYAWPRRPRVTLVVLLLAFATLGTLTVRRNAVWSSALSLWEDALAKSPDKARPHMAVGWLYGNEGRLIEAERELERAVALDPDYAMAWNNLGIVVSRRGNHARAAEAYAQAVRLYPNRPVLWANLGTAQRRSGEPVAAAASFERCLSMAPRHPGALNELAALRLREGRLQDALDLARRADARGKARPGLLESIEEAIRTADQGSPEPEDDDGGRR